MNANGCDRYYTAPHVLSNADRAVDKERWADEQHVDIDTIKKRLTWRDGQLVPFGSVGTFDSHGKPNNPYEPSTKYGRYSLGKWGPNHAADPVITADPLRANDPPRVLLVVRGDCGKLALPGGMVDAGEVYAQSVVRECFEEAAEDSSLLRDIFAKRGTLVYSGYVHDPRNTQNAWMETAAVHVHLSVDEADALCLRPSADGETLASKWVDVTPSLLASLYASHGTIVSRAAENIKPRRHIKCGVILVVPAALMLLFVYSSRFAWYRMLASAAS